MPEISRACSILIIDDNADDRDYYRRALGRAKDAAHNISEAVDGTEGLSLLNGQKFDCILLDYSLPGRNGLEILRDIRADHPHLAVIMLTGQGDIDIAISALKDGANDYLVKAPDLLANDIASITHPDDRTEEMTQLIGIWAEEQGTRHYEKRFVHRRGQIITVLQSVSLVRHRNGQPNYLVVQMLDLTERRKVDRMKSEFISTVSHELRTPLTSVRGSLGLIVQPFAGELTGAGRELVEIAASNCDRLIALINDILDIDKIAAGEMRMDMRDHDLAALIDRSILANRTYADRVGIALVGGSMPGGARIRVDEARFVQIMSNLLSNAVKFSGTAKQVDIGVRNAGAKLRISVTDHGTGIPEEFRERMFGKFAQADSSVARSKNGSGLGLHISRQLVEAMGGSIGFDSKEGVGTTFHVDFPAVAPSLAMAESPEVQPPSALSARTEATAFPRPRL